MMVQSLGHYGNINPFRKAQDCSLYRHYPLHITVAWLVRSVYCSYILFCTLYAWPKYLFNHSLLFTNSINMLHWNVLAKTFLFRFMFKTWTTVVWKYIVDAHRSKMRWICHVHFKFKGILLIQSNPRGDGELGFSSACLPDLQRHNKMLEKIMKINIGH